MRHTPRHVHFVTYANYINKWWLGWFAKRIGMIPIRPGSKSSIVESIRAAREELKEGKVVGIFPEGTLSRDGKMGDFERGFLSILKNTDAVIMPVYLEGLWGSIFSFHGGYCFWKLPETDSVPVGTFHYGKPLWPMRPKRLRYKKQSPVLKRSAQGTHRHWAPKAFQTASG